MSGSLGFPAAGVARVSQRFAVFCPGQGAQHASMFALTERESVQALPAWSASNLHEILTDPAALFANRYAQPLIVSVGLARWQEMRSRLPVPSLIAGYSVGELTAYGVAGALDSATMISLAEVRASAMDACVETGKPQCMLAISGLMAAQVLPILQQYGLAIAIQNDSDRLVAGGLADDCTLAEPALLALGADCLRLPVAVASHTALMKNAVITFAAALDQSVWSPMITPVLAGINAHKICTTAAAISALQAQLTTTIHWQDCMDACVENGIEAILELGPGNTLSRMMMARHPAVACRSLDEFRSIGAAADWLLRQVD